MLKIMLAKIKYPIPVAVLFSLIAPMAGFIWGSVKTVIVILHLATSNGKDPLGAVELISIMDTFPMAALFILSIGLYEFFIGDVAMPAWLVVRNLLDLKAKLVSVLAATFVEHFVAWKDPHGTCTSELLPHLFPHHSLRSIISAKKIDAV